MSFDWGWIVPGLVSLAVALVGGGCLQLFSKYGESIRRKSGAVDILQDFAEDSLKEISKNGFDEVPSSLDFYFVLSAYFPLIYRECRLSLPKELQIKLKEFKDVHWEELKHIDERYDHGWAGSPYLKANDFIDRLKEIKKVCEEEDRPSRWSWRC